MNKKVCSKCKVEKPYDEFVKSKSSVDGVWCYCKKCHRKSYKKKLPEMKRTRTHKQCRMCNEMKLFSDYTTDSIKNHTYCIDCRRVRGLQANLERYGLTPEQYIAMEKAQGGVCKICGQREDKKKRLAIDHDHRCCPGLKSCGKCVRGLLCAKCNNGLGSFGDDIDILNSAIKYLSN